MDRSYFAGTLCLVEGREDSSLVRPVQHRPKFHVLPFGDKQRVESDASQGDGFFILQITLAVSLLITLIIGANAISGERENGTFESLLVTPVSRRQIILGKFLAAYRLGLLFWPSLRCIWRC